MRAVPPRSSMLLPALLLLGCRTIWVHPDATAQKYADDTFFCKHGIERSEWKPDPEQPRTDSDRAWALEGGSHPAVVLPGWKRFMVRLGWHTTAGNRSDKPWRATDERPRKTYGKR